MRKNMGTVDRVIRTLIAVAIAVLYFTGVLGGTLALILGVVAVIFLLTSLVSFCPGYLPFGISTCAQEQPPAAPAAPKA
jgi:hypothetical protein